MQNTPLHILLVEDNPADARIIEVLLAERHAASVTTERADTLDRALAALERGRGRFDLILLDLGLPDSHSLDTLRAVTASSHAVPIVVLSGLADETVGVQAVREGAQDYLVKGRIDSELLARTVRYAIERHRAESALRESEELNRRILDVVPGGVAEVNMAGQIESANSVALRLLGLSLAELRRLNVTDFRSCVLEDGTPCPPENFPVSRCIATGQQQPPCTLGLPGSDGNMIWAVFSATPLTEPRSKAQVGAVVTFLDITDRKRADESLREREKQYRDLVETSNDLIWSLDREHRWTFLNRGATKRILGYTPEEMLGRYFMDFEHKEGIERDLSALEVLRLGGSMSLHETTFVRKDGTPVQLSFNAIALKDEHGKPVGTTGTASDISQRKLAEEALRESEARYRAVVEDQTELLCRYRPDGTLTFVNDACCRFFGRARDELIGTSLFDAVLPADREMVRAHIMSLNRIGPAQLQEQRVISGTGEVRWHQWFNRVVQVQNAQPVELQGLGRDITAQKIAEQALHDSEEQLRHAQKLDAVGMLASGVAHDFNNLLTAIRGYASLARSTLGENHPALESLDQVEEASRQATGVAGALLTFARKARTEKIPVELAATIESAVRLFRRTLPPNLRLHIDTAKGTNLWVQADSTQLQQVVMNLGLNARDAIRREGVISIIVEPVLPYAEAGSNGTPRAAAPTAARLIVRDTGSGIKPDIKTRIFEPFFTTKPRGRGTGLGLAVIHGIVQDHGGTITVESEPDQGATFTVVLPLITPPHRAAEPRRVSDTAPLTGGLALLAEHNQLVRGLLASMLSALGYEVEHAATATEALDRTSMTDRAFDLVVAEQNLPGSEAGSLERRLAERGHQVRTIIVTDAAVAEGPPVPGVVRLRKPFQLADLRRAIVTLLADGVEGTA